MNNLAATTAVVLAGGVGSRLRSVISDRPKVLVLTGPTAVGKTRASLALAEALNGEIISADSVQVYRGLDIGSDKVRRSAGAAGGAGWGSCAVWRQARDS